MFRANEEAEKRRAESEGYFILRSPGSYVRDPKCIYQTEEEEEQARRALDVIHRVCGNYADSYPEWHPLLANVDSLSSLSSWRSEPKIPHLDHTRKMVGGMITCPYGHGLTELFDFVNKSFNEFAKNDRVGPLDSWAYMTRHVCSVNAAFITNELIDYLEESLEAGEFDGYGGDHRLLDSDWSERPNEIIHFYSREAYPILIWLEWRDRFALNDDGTISSAAAVPLMLTSSLGDIPQASVAEEWEDMKGLLLGHPHGARSSLFVNQQTAKYMRQSFDAVVKSGAFGDHRYS